MGTALQVKVEQPTLDNLIEALTALQKEGHGNDLIVMSKDAEGNGYAYLNNIEVFGGALTLWPSHRSF